VAGKQHLMIQRSVLNRLHFDPVLRAIVDISILVTFAKILAGVMKRFDMPEVLGELFAGIILGPFALGSVQLSGEPLVAFI